jgi:hypothetical protein
VAAAEAAASPNLAGAVAVVVGGSATTASSAPPRIFFPNFFKSLRAVFLVTRVIRFFPPANGKGERAIEPPFVTANVASVTGADEELILLLFISIDIIFYA